MANGTARTTNTDLSDRMAHIEGQVNAQSAQMTQIAAALSKLSDDVKAMSKPNLNLIIGAISLFGGLIGLYLSGPKETIDRNQSMLSAIDSKLSQHTQLGSHPGTQAQINALADLLKRSRTDAEKQSEVIAEQARNIFTRSDFDKYVLGRFVPNEAKLAKLGQELAAFRAKTDTGSRFTREDFDRYVLPRLDAIEEKMAEQHAERSAIDARQTECMKWLREAVKKAPE